MLNKIKDQKENLIAFIRDVTDKTFINDFPPSYHKHIEAELNKMVRPPIERIIIQRSRQMGKTTASKIFIEAFATSVEKPIYIKKFYLRSGTFEFRLYMQDKNWELIKLTKPGRWQATNMKYILDFLVRRGAKSKDIFEVEQKIFERM
jgi:hypothetical protein